MLDILEIDCDLMKGRTNFHLGKPIKGRIKLVPKKDLYVFTFGYEEVIETKGKKQLDEVVVSTKYILYNEKLEQGLKYEYEIEIKNEIYENYKGELFELKYRVDLFIEITPKPIKGELPKFHLINMLNSENRRTMPIYISFESANQGYKIVDKTYNLDLKLPMSYLFLIFGAAVAFLLSKWFEQSLIKTMSVYVFLVLCYLLFYYIQKRSLNKIIANLVNLNEEEFRVELKNADKWKKVKQVFVNYSILEEVIDERDLGGEDSGPSIVTKKVFSSAIQSKRNPTSSLTLDFKYPEKIYPVIDIGKSKIMWMLELMIKLNWGYVLKYKNECNYSVPCGRVS